MRGLTDDERNLINHVTRWGSDGYPIHRYKSGKWAWGPWRSVNGPPVCFRTKRDATASFEAFHEVLLDALAGRI